MKQDLTPDELVEIPTCNLSETVHNKWLQAFGKRGTDFFVATCDDWIRAFMQMTNYRSYLCGSASGKGPSKHDLKLKLAMASLDGKNIAQTLNKMPGAEDVCTRVPHLEREELFGSVKRKLDLPIGSEGDSHRSDKVNFSQPRVQTRFASSRVQLQPIPEVTSPMPHVTHVQEIDCNVHKWHIARISHKAKNKCHAVEAQTNIRCKMVFAKGGKATAAPTYKGERQVPMFRGARQKTEDFWFCLDQIA